ncbi:rCG22748 [Rattus norvegicus]|uniref:RCG22748 n=1 Tax=Rattus norvegicus TaxID=10116 RepID=A6JYB5_RAT|nr:rCG22748 [Rattus norvegicus]
MSAQSKVTKNVIFPAFSMWLYESIPKTFSAINHVHTTKGSASELRSSLLLSSSSSSSSSLSSSLYSSSSSSSSFRNIHHLNYG